MPDNTWLAHRNRGLHVTIRDVDCRDFDVPRFIKDLQSLHVSFFSFFVGGYVTTYPTRLEFQRMSPYLNGRDLAGEIIQAAHAAGIKTLAMIDTGQLPEHAAQAHPEWCVHDAHNQPVKGAEGVYQACPLGGYQRDYVKEIVAEILSRYPVDCIKFGGSSFGFPRRVCYCPNCQAQFQQDTGLSLPPEAQPDHPTWNVYTQWRQDRTRQRARALADTVHALDPAMPVMGNGVAFGDPGWTLGSALDIEYIASVSDAVQLEVQTRARYDPATGAAPWQWISWPAETARYFASVYPRAPEGHPTWVVASYFLAWPWRRSAVPPAEQKVYLAQIAANGADPMVNLSGGPPAVHEDPRGFQAVRELYGFLAAHQSFYENDRSGANLAILYSLATLNHDERQGQAEAYLASIRGFEQALHEAHLPFDILSTEFLTSSNFDPARLRQYDALILPSAACLSDEQTRVLQDYAAQGGGLVATFETGRFTLEGQPRPDFALAETLGAHFTGQVLPAIGGDESGYKQAYLDLPPQPATPAAQALLSGLEDTRVLPAGGAYCQVRPTDGVQVPLTLSAPFIVFPEGFSYPRQPASRDPQALLTETGSTRAVYFPGQPDLLFWTIHDPSLGRLLVNAVRWAAQDRQPLEVQAPSTLQVSLRVKHHLRLVHLINLTGGPRYF